MGEGDGVKEEERMVTIEEAIEKIIGRLDHVIETVESENDITPEVKTTKEVEILPGFPSKVEGEILFCDADNINVSYRSPETLFRGLAPWKTRKRAFADSDLVLNGKS